MPFSSFWDNNLRAKTLPKCDTDASVSQLSSVKVHARIMDLGLWPLIMIPKWCYSIKFKVNAYNIFKDDIACKTLIKNFQIQKRAIIQLKFMIYLQALENDFQLWSQRLVLRSEYFQYFRRLVLYANYYQELSKFKKGNNPIKIHARVMDLWKWHPISNYYTFKLVCEVKSKYHFISG
jgi:hypothetical protein